MKRITAIVLMCLLLFNMLGYYGLFETLKYRNTQMLIDKFDANDYEHLETVVLKFPHKLLYVVDHERYQRVDGEFEHEGDIYRLVKQRITPDSIYLVCVKDVKSIRIHKALSDYVKSFTDHTSGSNQSKKGYPSFSKDYCAASFSILTTSYGWEYAVWVGSPLKHFLSQHTHSILLPPELA